MCYSACNWRNVRDTKSLLTLSLSITRSPTSVLEYIFLKSARLWWRFVAAILALYKVISSRRALCR